SLSNVLIGNTEAQSIPMSIKADGEVVIGNQPPELKAIGNKSVNRGDLLKFTISASDPNDDELTCFASNLPPGASFNAKTCTFTWIPTYTQTGKYPNIHFEVSDGQLTDSENITVTVKTAYSSSGYTGASFASTGFVGGGGGGFVSSGGSATPANLPPVLNSIGYKNINEGEQLQFTISATDPNSQNLTYSASSLPSGASFDPSTNTFSWTPGYDQAGTYPSVHFQASDGMLVDSEDIFITVNDVSSPPTFITFIPPTDSNNATVTRNWTEVSATITNTIETSSFIDWNRSLVGYWNLDDNSGSTASDNSTYSNTANLLNDPQWTPGKFGSALYFDGDNDYVHCGKDIDFNITDEITIETWANPAIAGEGGPNNAILAKAESGLGWSWQLRYNGPGNYMGFNFNGNSEGPTWVSTNQNLSPGEWYHIVGVFDGTTIKCYLNGIETDSEQISGIVGSNSSLFIGQDGWGNVFNGNVDEVKIWNRALSSDEIKSSYNTTNTLSRQFTNLPDGIYEYYAHITDTIANSYRTETRYLTINTTTTVDPGPINQPPILNPVGNRSVDADNSLQFTVYATDPENDTLTYSASNLPSGASFNANTRTFSWTPSSPGTYSNVRFVVSDGELTDSEDITIEVADDTGSGVGNGEATIYVVPTITDDKILPTSSISSGYISNQISIAASPSEFEPASFVVRANQN
ncbi:MAG: hypothetical protein GY845_01975, partial [Planctomycetes bacterium]|nr:hypothetical protein [Planctomycetota bacterium]